MYLNSSIFKDNFVNHRINCSVFCVQLNNNLNDNDNKLGDLKKIYKFESYVTGEIFLLAFLLYDIILYNLNKLSYIAINK